MVLLNVKGKVMWIVLDGEYSIDEKVIEIEFGGVVKEFSMK